MTAGLLILAACLVSLGCGIGLGFDLARRRREAEQDARVRRLMRDIKGAPAPRGPNFWLNHPLWHCNSFATIDELMPRVVEVSDD